MTRSSQRRCVFHSSGSDLSLVLTFCFVCFLTLLFSDTGSYRESYNVLTLPSCYTHALGSHFPRAFTILLYRQIALENVSPLWICLTLEFQTHSRLAVSLNHLETRRKQKHTSCPTSVRLAPGSLLRSPSLLHTQD